MSEPKPFGHERFVGFRGVRIVGYDRDDGGQVVGVPFEQCSDLLYSFGLHIGIEQDARRIS